MPGRRYVVLDPDAMADGAGWLYVVVRAKTGVWYRQQYGGTACRQGEVEGFLVPVLGPGSYVQLRELFEGHFGGAGTWRHRWRDKEIENLRDLVQGISYWASDAVSATRRPLRLDERCLGDADEAWVPVLTPDGPGVLVWSNSD
jgi:Family of unknown function (DUF6210)